MSTVELVLTDTRLWARSEATHWDGPPSIVPASDGTSFVVGEALRPQYPAVSVVRLADADRIAFPALPTLADAFAVLFGAVLTNLRLTGPCERLTVLAPSDWGRRRRAAVEAAASRLVADVTVEPLALRAVSLGASTAQHQRIAVLELNPLSTTVTLVGRSGSNTWIDACEHEPTVGLADAQDGPGLDAVGAVVARLLAGQTPTYLLAVGISDPALLEALRTAIAGQCGFPVDVRPVAGTELIRGSQPLGHPAQPSRYGPAAPPPVEWDAPLREHAVAAQPPRSRRTLVTVGAAAAVVALVVAVGVAVLLTRSSGGTTAAPPATQQAAPPTARPTPQTFGRVQTPIPAGWRIASQNDNRVDLSPDSGARQRITLTQKDLAPGSSVDEVARTLEAQIQRRPAGTVTDLRRDPAFGGRPGLSYEEFPPDGTTVRWQVIVDSGLQVSVGCQYPSDSWQPIATPCEQLVRDMRITR
ncbi:type VII secretion-associated protein [Nocardia mexicana]|uniref:Type VII secretion-associated protein (TIGR03931 family) n=1 Tax=Nocardia mexicana TaxID=279262 RepID=A0A370H9G7_9NOCA|nr:type VII secretion-associated protein [Nocardia mexicana]RDI52664.1 type VII secretion-associated protein (TIGR03931 family) [Nocardia mexicana]